MIRRSGNRFAEEIMRDQELGAGSVHFGLIPRRSMIRRSGNRFAEEIMRDERRRMIQAK
jgi:phosphopantetheinyl transferase (holo-ACP synthase)